MLYLLVIEKALVSHYRPVVMVLLFLFQRNRSQVFPAPLNTWHSCQSRRRALRGFRILDLRFRIADLYLSEGKRPLQAAFLKTQHYKAPSDNSLKNNEPIRLGKETIWNAESYT